MHKFRDCWDNQFLNLQRTECLRGKEKVNSIYGHAAGETKLKARKIKTVVSVVYTCKN
jgi:hypothetical protein